MIKYSNRKDEFNNYEKNSSIYSYDLQSYTILNQWKSFSPTNMTKYITDDESFQVIDSFLNMSWKAFNHNENDYADLGVIDYNNKSISIMSFIFKNKKCINSIKFKLEEINYPINVKLQFSIDNICWQEIGNCNVGYNVNFNENEWNNVIHYFNENTNEINYLKYSPIILCQFNNYKQYKYYRLTFSSLKNKLGLRISKMSLYDDYSILSSFFSFQLSSNANDISNTIIGNNNSVKITNRNGAFIENNSYIKYSPYFLDNFNDFTISFYLRITDKQGIIFYKTNSFYLFYSKLNSDLIFEFVNNNVKYTFNIGRISNDLYYFAIIFNNDNCKLFFNNDYYDFIKKENLYIYLPVDENGFYLGNCNQYFHTNSSTYLRKLSIYNRLLSENDVMKDKYKSF